MDDWKRDNKRPVQSCAPKRGWTAFVYEIPPKLKAKQAKDPSLEKNGAALKGTAPRGGNET